MRADAAFRGQDAFGGNHAAQVFRRGFVADEEDLLALGSSRVGAVRVQVNLAGGGARTGGQALGNDLGGLLSFRLEDRGEELVELIGWVALDGGLPVNELLLDHVHRELQRGHGGALAVARLEHEHLAVLDRELKVLHVLEVRLQRVADVVQFLVGGGHLLVELRDGLGRADAGDDVFALRVDEEFAVKLLRAVGRVARERDAGTGGVTGVAIDHRLHVDGGSPFGGDAVFAAIHDRAVVHPRAEHGAGSAPELLPRILRKLLAGALFDQRLEPGDEFLLVGSGELGVFDVRVILLMLEPWMTTSNGS